MFRRIISGLLTSLVAIVGALVVPQRLTAQPWFGFETSVDLLDGRVGLGIMQWRNRVGFQDMAVPESNPFNNSVPDHFASNRWAPVTEVSMRIRLFGLH